MLEIQSNLTQVDLRMYQQPHFCQLKKDFLLFQVALSQIIFQLPYLELYQQLIQISYHQLTKELIMRALQTSYRLLMMVIIQTGFQFGKNLLVLVLQKVQWMPQVPPFFHFLLIFLIEEVHPIFCFHWVKLEQALIQKVNQQLMLLQLQRGKLSQNLQ